MTPRGQGLGSHPAKCESVQSAFSAYLDGAVSGREMHAIAAHLKECRPCDMEFHGWRAVQHALGSLRSTKAPSDMGLKLRVAISQQKARRDSRWTDRLVLRWENALRPVILQAAAGVAGTIALVGTAAMLVGLVAAPGAVMAHDVPLGAMTAPHYLYSADQQRPIITDRDTTIVVEAAVNAAGQVYDYRFVSDPESQRVQNEVAERLMLSVFEPARVFGAPVRGHVIMTFAGISVRG